MTIGDAISLIDNLKPNTYGREEKVRWLSEVDASIFENIIKKHEGYDGGEFAGYTPSSPDDTVLLAPHPYDKMYPFCLEYHIDYFNGEYGKYNNSASMFSSAMAEFSAFYQREHRSTKTSKFRFFRRTRR